MTPGPQCDAEASEQADQRSEWQENYTRECMHKKGFKERATI